MMGECCAGYWMLVRCGGGRRRSVDWAAQQHLLCMPRGERSAGPQLGSSAP